MSEVTTATATTNLGRVSIVPKGDYDATVQYSRLDVVKYNRDSYLAKTSVKGVTPGTDATKWMLLVEGAMSVPEAEAIVEDLEDDVSQLQSATSDNLNVITSPLYDGTDVEAYSESSGYKLTGVNGLCAQDDGYKLEKYVVTAGDTLQIISPHRFQFQSAAGVPASGTNQYLIGDTKTDGAFYTLVPTGATWLIISVPASGTASVKRIESVVSSLVPLKNISYKNTGNLLDFGFIGGTWEQGSIGNTNPYQCKTRITVAPNTTLYGVVNGAKMSQTPALSAYTLQLWCAVYDSTDTQIISPTNLSNSSGQLTTSLDLPASASYAIVWLTSGVWDNQFTPSTLDNAAEAFAYLGYDDITYEDVVANYEPYPAYNDGQISSLKQTVQTLGSEITKNKAQINDASVFVKGSTPEELTAAGGYYKTDGTLFSADSTQFLHYDIAVLAGEQYEITALFSTDSRFVEYIFFDAANNVVSYHQASADGANTIHVTVPSGAVKMGFNNYYSFSASCYKFVQINTKNYVDDTVSNWYGKKIVWFGTSIPAGVINAGASGGNGAYPTRIGQNLGATVYNESIGSSRVRGGNYHAITADDPMGWGGCEAIGVMLSMSLSRAEKQAIIDAWDSKWKNIMLEPNTYNPDNITGYLNSSWDAMLTKYLTGGTVGQCDLYVFDHGYNDGVVTYGFSDLAEIPAQENDRTYWWGAMNFLVGKILADNPRAKILIIGHYNYSSDPFSRGANWAGKYVCDAQKAYAESWGMTCVETWKLLGLTMNTITVNGSATPVIYARYPDHLHPVSDSSGYELTRYADALTPYVNAARGT